VASLNRPGGNLTGVTFFVLALGAKQFGFLRELVPYAVTIGMLVNPRLPRVPEGWNHKSSMPAMTASWKRLSRI
jgi:hypothetical protein